MGKKQLKTLSLDVFKEFAKTNDAFRQSLKRFDIIDYDNGTATIYRENLMKELERFACKNEDDLSDFLWYNYGIFASVVD